MTIITMLQYLLEDVLTVDEAKRIIKSTQDKLDVVCFEVLSTIVEDIDDDILSKEEALRLVQRRIKAYKDASIPVPRYVVHKYNEVLIK
jgi:hypothetical protein